MKKLSLLVGTLGGATAGYLFSNKKLREQLADVDDAEEAAKLLGKHLQKDGKKLAKHIQEFIQSDEVQENLGVAKEFSKRKVAQAKQHISSGAKKGATQVKKKATSTAKRASSKAKKSVKKSVKKGVKKASAKKKPAAKKKKEIGR